MDGNNLIVLGLDLSKTKANFDTQLLSICNNISSTQTAKIALSLDVGKTAENFKGQLNSLLAGLNNSTNNAFNGVTSAAQKAQKPVDNLTASITKTSEAQRQQETSLAEALQVD